MSGCYHTHYNSTIKPIAGPGKDQLRYIVSNEKSLCTRYSKGKGQGILDQDLFFQGPNSLL